MTSARDASSPAARPRGADRPLRVLALAGSDVASGAGIAASRLHEGLLGRGVRSRLLVKEKTGSGEGVEQLRRSRLGRWALFHAQRIERKSGFHLMLHPSSPGRPFAERLAESDVLQLHDVQSQFVNPAAVARWSRRRPVVWTLHDMWAATGKCIYSLECARWLTGCGRCPLLAQWPVLERDRTDFLWRWKRRLFLDAKIHLVTPSRWLADIARRSPLLSRMNVEVIAYGIDLSTFRPGRDVEARRRLGIADGAVVVAFGAHAAVPRKGFVHLLAATAARRSAGTLVVLAAGERPDDFVDEPGVVWAGPVAAGGPMAALLRAADLACLPTLADNLPLVLLEAAATGLPAVAFDVGGVGDAVRDGETGLLAPAGDASALAVAIEALADDPARRAAMGLAARKLAEREFDERETAVRYETLYRRLLTEADGSPAGFGKTVR